MRDESAVEPLQRHHIADGRERHEIEQAEKIGFGPIGIEAAAAEHSRHRDQEQEDHARGGEMTLAGEIVLPVGVDHRERRRQCLVGLMVIDDDDFGAGLIGGFDGGLAGGAAVDGQNESRSLGHELGERRRRRAIAFGEAVGNIGRCFASMGAQITLDQSDG